MNNNKPYGVTYKYYHGEEVSPFPKEDFRSKFWWGEMMFATNNLSVEEWKGTGEEILKNARKRVVELASRYTAEQFGVIIYIETLFGKWCPYDDLEWIFEY